MTSESVVRHGLTWNRDILGRGISAVLGPWRLHVFDFATVPEFGWGCVNIHGPINRISGTCKQREAAQDQAASLAALLLGGAHFIPTENVEERALMLGIYPLPEPAHSLSSVQLIRAESLSQHFFGLSFLDVLEGQCDLEDSPGFSAPMAARMRDLAELYDLAQAGRGDPRRAVRK